MHCDDYHRVFLEHQSPKRKRNGTSAGTKKVQTSSTKLRKNDSEHPDNHNEHAKLILDENALHTGIVPSDDVTSMESVNIGSSPFIGASFKTDEEQFDTTTDSICDGIQHLQSSRAYVTKKVKVKQIENEIENENVLSTETIEEITYSEESITHRGTPISEDLKNCTTEGLPEHLLEPKGHRRKAHVLSFPSPIKEEGSSDEIITTRHTRHAHHIGSPNFDMNDSGIIGLQDEDDLFLEVGNSSIYSSEKSESVLDRTSALDLSHSKFDQDLSYKSPTKEQHISSNLNHTTLSTTASKASRPLPDPSAFDRSFPSASKHSPLSSPMPVCPATPSRIPNWQDEDDAVLNRSSSFIPPVLARQNSLVTSKVLLVQDDDDVDNAEEINFARDFENEGLLGSGTFSDVYRVKEKRDNRHYAVKKSRQKFRSRKDREWLLNEVRTMKLIGQVHCDNIVHLVRAWQEGGYFYVQTDLADKGNLKDVINMAAANSNPLNYSTLWHIVHDVALGLEHIHNFGMVHLDIKPANLLIDESGRIKIGDFGMAVAQGSCEDGHEGDTRYLAGEILSSMSRDSPADIFSFGISMYEICLSGRRPFTLPAEGPCWQALRNGCGEPMHLEDDDLNNLVENMMAQDPQHRYRSDQIVALPKVKAVDGTVDPFLSSIDQQRPHNPLNRAFSFLPLQDIELAWNNGAVDGTGPDALLANSRMAVVTPTSELAVAMWKQQNMSRK